MAVRHHHNVYVTDEAWRVFLNTAHEWYGKGHLLHNAERDPTRDDCVEAALMDFAQLGHSEVVDSLSRVIPRKAEPEGQAATAAPAGS